MNGKQLKETLLKVEAGELYNIFNLLPEVAGGEAWAGEIKDCAQSMRDYLTDDEDYKLDDLRDLSMSYAEREVEDYHSTINKRVQELSLWASPELDSDVQEMNEGRDYPNLTDLNTQYLYAASVQLFSAVADQAFQNTEEGEE
jgi:hypothetical protein